MVKKQKPKVHESSGNFEQKENLEEETEDIYDDEQREEMLKDDEITASENAFMEGREMRLKRVQRSKNTSHDDSISVELSKKEYEED